VRQMMAYVVSAVTDPEVLTWIAAVGVAAALGAVLVTLIVRKP
jgi:hypothetical protein